MFMFMTRKYFVNIIIPEMLSGWSNQYTKLRAGNKVKDKSATM